MRPTPEFRRRCRTRRTNTPPRLRPNHTLSGSSYQLTHQQSQHARHRRLYSIAGRRDYRTAGAARLAEFGRCGCPASAVRGRRPSVLPGARSALSSDPRRTKGCIMTTTVDATTAVLGGGCFWCLEAVFDQLAGVQSVDSGYAGGRAPDPSYEEVCEGTSG